MDLASDRFAQQLCGTIAPCRRGSNTSADGRHARTRGDGRGGRGGAGAGGRAHKSQLRPKRVQQAQYRPDAHPTAITPTYRVGRGSRAERAAPRRRPRPLTTPRKDPVGQSGRCEQRRARGPAQLAGGFSRSCTCSAPIAAVRRLGCVRERGPPCCASVLCPCASSCGKVESNESEATRGAPRTLWPGSASEHTLAYWRR